MTEGKHVAEGPTKQRSNLETKLKTRALAASCLLLALLGAAACSKQYEPPVIQGVQEQVQVEEGSDLTAVLLGGVTGVGGPDRPDETFEVTVSVYDQGDNLVTECVPGTYRVVYSCQDPQGNQALPVEAALVVSALDTEAPVISGAQDLEVEANGAISYRDGVTVTDNVDPSVQLQIDSSAVNLAEPGLYMVFYSATDSSGNRSETVVQVTVTEPVSAPEPGRANEPTLPAIPEVVTQEMVDELADNILKRITNDGMTLREKAYAVYKYVFKNIKYVGTSDKSSWLKGAYTGFVQGRGDCFNYFACSKALLTRLGIPSVDLQRVGGTTRHYWQLINLGEGWYHFDACWHPVGYHIESFMLTEQEVRDYTELVSHVRKNYFVYDYDNCPVIAVGTPEGEAQARRDRWAAIEAGQDPDAPAAGPETPPETTQTPTETPTETSTETSTEPPSETPQTTPEAPAVTPENPVEAPDASTDTPEAPAESPETPTDTPEAPVETPETAAEPAENPGETPADEPPAEGEA